MEFDIQSTILAAVPFILGIGIVWARFQRVLNAIKELADVLTVCVAAFDDKNLSREEIQKIKKEGIEAIAALKAIFK